MEIKKHLEIFSDFEIRNLLHGKDKLILHAKGFAFLISTMPTNAPASQHRGQLLAGWCMGSCVLQHTFSICCRHGLPKMLHLPKEAATEVPESTGSYRGHAVCMGGSGRCLQVQRGAEDEDDQRWSEIAYNSAWNGGKGGVKMEANKTGMGPERQPKGHVCKLVAKSKKVFPQNKCVTPPPTRLQSQALQTNKLQRKDDLSCSLCWLAS